MGEMDIAVENLNVGLAVLVGMKFVGMNEVHPSVAWSSGTCTGIVSAPFVKTESRNEQETYYPSEGLGNGDP